jgi:hypothetical protein
VGENKELVGGEDLTNAIAIYAEVDRLRIENANLKRGRAMDMQLSEVRKKAMVLLLTRDKDDPELREVLDEEERLGKEREENG